MSTNPPSGHLSTPAGTGPWPAVVVIHEIFGLNDDIRGLADEAARRGYLALAPDFYDGGPWLRCMKVAFRDLKAGEGPFFDRIEAARSWLAGREDCTGRVGVIGFCLGGGFALLAAPRSPFAAASVNYGEVPEDVADLLRGACPIVASYGARDRVTRGHADRLRTGLEMARVDHDVKLYPGVGHGFLNRARYGPALSVISRVMGMHAGYDEAAAADAWARIDAFFDRHLREAGSSDA